MLTNDEIIRIEMEAIKADLINAYNTSGKRTTGEFERGLEVTYSTNSATVLTFNAGGTTKTNGIVVINVTPLKSFIGSKFSFL